MRILIVEDEVRLAETLKQLLEDQRYQADAVFDGADGVASRIARTCELRGAPHVDLILTDPKEKERYDAVVRFLFEHLTG